MKPILTLTVCRANCRVTRVRRDAGSLAVLVCCGVLWGWILYHLVVWVWR